MHSTCIKIDYSVHVGYLCVVVKMHNMTVKTTNNAEKNEVVDGYMVGNFLQGLHAVFIHYS